MRGIHIWSSIYLHKYPRPKDKASAYIFVAEVVLQKTDIVAFESFLFLGPMPVIFLSQ